MPQIEKDIGLTSTLNKKGVQQLLHLVNHVGKFMLNLSEMTALLRELLVKNVSWHWGNEQDVAFRKIKEVLVSKRCLVYYDVNKSVRMKVDARWKASCICFKVTYVNSTKICNY